MVRWFFMLAAVIASLCSPALAGDKACDDCDVLQHGVHRKVIKSNDVVCIFFVQPRQSNVLLRLDLTDGTSRRYTKMNAGKSGRFCIGRHWVQKSTFMTICDDDYHADYVKEHIDIVARKPKLSQDAEACLYGKDACEKMGYLVRK